MENLKKVTTLSKTLAVICLAGVLVSVFAIGRSYQSVKEQKIPPVLQNTQDEKQVKSESYSPYYISQKLGVITRMTQSGSFPANDIERGLHMIETGNKICVASNSGDYCDTDYIEVFRKEKEKALSRAVTEQFIRTDESRKNCFAVAGEDFNGPKNSIYIIDRRVDAKTPEGRKAIDGINAGAAGTFEPDSLAYVYSQMEDFCYPPFATAFFEDSKDKTYFYKYTHTRQAVPPAFLEITALGVNMMLLPFQYGTTFYIN